MGEVTNIAIVLLIGTSYCVICPFIMPACLVFFVFAGMIYRWLFSAVYVDVPGCHGEFWYQLFKGTMIGLECGIISVYGYIQSAGAGWWTSHLLALLIILVLIFHVRVSRHHYQASTTLPYQDGVELDRCTQMQARDFKADMYVDPIL